jgi:N-acetyl-1-D-myo-inositol-2-amino-2-deoxy-alpha-D-glucopyranoside deacetylase
MSVFDPRRLLLIFAHPGDESVFAGHIISQALERGVRVQVLTLTRGERGQTSVAELTSLNSNLTAMALHREAELTSALNELGGPQHRFAGTRAYLDSGYRVNAWGQLGKPRDLDELSLAATATSIIAADILTVMREFRPDTVITHHSRGASVHPDYRAAHLATAMAIRKYRAENVPPDFFVTVESGRRADVEITDRTASAKRAALTAHRSQVQIDREGFKRGGQSDKFLNPEKLARASAHPMVRLLPLLTYFWALPLGALVAIAGTLIHQVRSSELSPIGLAIALTMIGSLAIALRLLRNSRGALYLMSLAFTVTILALAQRQGAGTVLIPANDAGTIWAYGSLALLFVIMLFPNLSRSAWRTKAS